MTAGLAIGAVGCGEKSEPAAATTATPTSGRLLVLKTRPGFVAEPVGSTLTIETSGQVAVCLSRRTRAGVRAYTLKLTRRRLSRIEKELDRIDLSGLKKGRPVPDQAIQTLTAKGTTVSNRDRQFSERLELFIADRLDPLVVFTRRDPLPRGARKSRRCAGAPAPR